MGKLPEHLADTLWTANTVDKFPDGCHRAVAGLRRTRLILKPGIAPVEVNSEGWSISLEESPSRQQHLPIARGRLEVGATEDIRDARLLERIVKQALDRLRSPKPHLESRLRLEHFYRQIDVEP